MRLLPVGSFVRIRLAMPVISVVVMLGMLAGFLAVMVPLTMRVVRIMRTMTSTVTFVQVLGLLEGMRIACREAHRQDKNRDSENKRLHFS